MEPGEVVVEARGIEKYFGTNHVLRGVDLDVRQHETVMLIGRSGSGKTTMLRCLNFLEEPTVGTVRIGDISVEAGIRATDTDGRGLGVLAAHLDDDSSIDLYVANDLTANFLFHNKGDGTFDDYVEPVRLKGWKWFF